MRKIGCLASDDPILRRRDFLRVGSLSLLGVSLSQFLRLQEALGGTPAAVGGKAQACILLWLEGGPSQIDMWDPKPNSSFRPIATNVAGIQVSELLPKTARHMDKLAIIRSLHTLENNHPRPPTTRPPGICPTRPCAFPAWGRLWPRNWVQGTTCRPTSCSRTPATTPFSSTISEPPLSATSMTPWCFPTPVNPTSRFPICDCPRRSRPNGSRTGSPFGKWWSRSTGTRCRRPNRAGWTRSPNRP